MADEPGNSAPLNPDLAGYPTVEALRDGYRASGEEAKRLRERAQELERTLASVLQATTANPRQAVPDRSKSPEDKLTDFGIPVDALREVVSKEIGGAFEPLLRGMQARGQVVASHPDYVKFESDVANFIQSDPQLSRDYSQMFAANPERAMEYAFLKFGDSRRRSASENGNGNAAPEGMGDARIPSSRAGDGRRAPSADDAVQSAYEQYMKTGSSRDAQAYAKARLRTVISDGFLSQ